MAYVTLDCNLYRNPKVRALGNSGVGRDARGLYIAAIMYARENLTDGIIHDHVLTDLDPALSPVQARKAVLLLVCCGLLKRRKGRNSGWIIPDYGNHQQTKEEVESDRQAARERKRRQRDREKSRRDDRDGHGVTGVTVTRQEKSREEEKNLRAVAVARPQGFAVIEGNGPGNEQLGETIDASLRGAG